MQGLTLEGLSGRLAREVAQSGSQGSISGVDKIQAQIPLASCVALGKLLSLLVSCASSVK